MTSDAWRLVLVAALGINAATGFGYRVYRLSKGGPLGDVIGQAVLGVLLLGLALAVALDAAWARWPALMYALLFGVAVMPVWVLAVLIPLRPRWIDYAFTVVYWICLVLVGLSALAL